MADVVALRCAPASDTPADDLSLRIGRSTFTRRNGVVEVVIDDVTAPWGRPVRARLRLWPTAPAVPPLRLSEAEAHFWQPLAPRARAWLQLPSGEVRESRAGYFDTNWGEVPLGGALPSWSWSRAHLSDRTHIRYRPSGGRPLDVVAQDGETAAFSPQEEEVHLRRTGWGLRVPRELVEGGAALVESSPFYARAVCQGEGMEVVSEVADFRRFRSPLIRWMAHFRMRSGR